MTPEELATWAEYARDSPLYSHLTRVIAADPDLLRVIGLVEHTPRPNMLFAAVQLIMAARPDEELASFYPNLNPDPRPVPEIDTVFRDFVLDHEEEIVAIGATRYTQTNESRRCTALLPAIWQGGLDRFHLVDIGTSAGLNLGLDRYGYRWGDVSWQVDSPLVLIAESRGIPPRPRRVDVLRRVGLDLNPVDPSDPQERAWLEALVWPEHDDRRERLRAALEIARDTPVELVAGDATVTLPGVLDGLDDNRPVVIINSFALMQFDLANRESLEEAALRERERRPVLRVSLEPVADRTDGAPLMVDDGTGWTEVGAAHFHGEWLELYARP